MSFRNAKLNSIIYCPIKGEKLICAGFLLFTTFFLSLFPSLFLIFHAFFFRFLSLFSNLVVKSAER